MIKYLDELNMYFSKHKVTIQIGNYLDALIGKFILKHFQVPSDFTVEFNIDDIHFILSVYCSIDTVSLPIGQNPVKIEFNNSSNSGGLCFEKCDPNALLNKVMGIIAIMQQ